MMSGSGWFTACRVVALALICCSGVLLAQSESDIKTMEKARALYSTGPVPSSISCGVVMDWDGFFERMKIEQTDATKERLAKIKAVKITVVTRDADHTDVKFEGGETVANGLTDGVRQQLQGFFQSYWSESYGRIVAKRGDVFELTTSPEGYLVKMNNGEMKVAIEMNKAYLITSESVDSPQMKAVVKPGFKAGTDGLLRLRTMDETVELGATKMVVSLDMDYQTVSGYDIPQHVAMALPGAFRFDYTLTGCEVKGESAPAPEQSGKS